MGAVLPPDEYGDWMSSAAAFKRLLPDDAEAAFQLFDLYSACSSKYEGSKATRRKFDDVAAHYDGNAKPVTTEMLHWRTRRHAVKVLETLYPLVTQPPPNDAPQFPDGTQTKVPPLSRDGIKPEDGIVALEYLLSCWSETVYRQITDGLAIPSGVREEVHRRVEETRTKIGLDGRILHTWEGQNLAADTAALADAIIGASPNLFRVDQTLVRITQPASDRATAQRVRKMHGYKGNPGVPGDPALHASVRLGAILSGDTEALREIIAAHVATKRRISIGTKQNPSWREEIASFPFKSSAKLHEEPDAAVLKDLGKRVLVKHVPEIIAVITAPVMPDLPVSTDPDDLLKSGVDRVIENAGFDALSGLYLSPFGVVVEVPQTPSEPDVKAAADLLRAPWVDFPFAPPGENMSAEVSRSVALYAMFLAVNRRALDIAPGIGISSHGEGMSSGKTLAGEVIGVMATGDLPVPVSLSTDFTEQRKEIITYFLEGDGCLFLDNIPTGTRFDAAPLASGMTSARFKGRLLGANKQIEVATRAMVTATGNSLNMAGDLASRFLLVRLDTGLERPEDRSVGGFRIRDLRRWVVEHRQQLVAAVHTIVRAYLQECRRRGQTPEQVVKRRHVVGTRFGGQCEVLRDTLLWAFPDLPDPFLSFQASALNSSTKAENALVLSAPDRIMTKAAEGKSAPAWTSGSSFSLQKSPERLGWETKFRARWHRMTPDQRQRRYRTANSVDAENQAWEHFQPFVRSKCGRRELRAGRARFSSTEIIAAVALHPDDRSTLEGIVHGKGLNPISLGRALKERLVDAPTNGFVLRSAQGRSNSAEFWIIRGAK
jgi:hypothetical protein